MKYSFTRTSGNGKTGPIPTTMTERRGCAPKCSFKKRGTKNNGCYADNAPLVWWWDKVKTRGVELETLCEKIKNLPPHQLWRHNVAGDLQHIGGFINRKTLEKLTQANKGKRGFSYTHHSLEFSSNAEAIQKANAEGFTINASCESVETAHNVKEKFGVPVVAVVHSDEKRKSWKTEKGTQVLRCPATWRDTNCAACGLCQKSERNFIVAFPAHGTKVKTVNQKIGEKAK